MILFLVATFLAIIVGGTVFFFGKSKEKFIYMCSPEEGLTEAHAGAKLINGAEEYGWTFVQMTPGPCAVFKKRIL